MRSIINKNYTSSQLFKKLIDQATNTLGIDVPSVDDLRAYESEQDERYLIFRDIYNYLNGTEELDEQVFQELGIRDPGDLLEFYVVFCTEFD